MGVERRETPGQPAAHRAANPRPEPPAAPRRPAKIAAGAFIAILYAGGMGLRGDWLPGIVGGILAGIVLVMVLTRVERRRRRR